jgi:hypothetical protein
VNDERRWRWAFVPQVISWIACVPPFWYGLRRQRNRDTRSPHNGVPGQSWALCKSAFARSAGRRVGVASAFAATSPATSLLPARPKQTRTACPSHPGSRSWPHTSGVPTPFLWASRPHHGSVPPSSRCGIRTPLNSVAPRCEGGALAVSRCSRWMPTGRRSRPAVEPRVRPFV